MNWTMFGKIVIRLLTILNLIRETAKEQEWSIEGFFSLLDRETGKEALKTATRIFLQEEERLRKHYFEMLEAHKTMSFEEANKWAESYLADGWRVPTTDDTRSLDSLFVTEDFYWLAEGWAVSQKSGGLHSSRRGEKRRACVIRELPPKTWQLV